MNILPRVTRLYGRRWLPFGFVLCSICLVVSGLITWLNVGWTDDFATRWMRGVAFALPVVPLGLAIAMGLGRVLGARLTWLPSVMTKMILALLTGCVMELLIAGVVTLSNHGATAGYGSAWWAAFSRSLPVGVVIGLAMAFVIKPWLEHRAATG